IEVQRADALAKGPEAPEHVERLYKERCQALDALLSEQPCFSLKSLAVNGRDLMAAGIPASPKLGAILEALLADVMEGKLPNEKEALLKEAVQRSGM
ncbi:MAG: tRNA nucleotidyltransferase, partial [Clostridia bacterium]|nr:tRNA nucleotidyltransferase [Clostridia bacterium]